MEVRSIYAPAAERRMMMDEVKYYPARMDYPNLCKPYSNADRIRSMADEELAAFLADLADDGNLRIREWLQQPAEGE